MTANTGREYQVGIPPAVIIKIDPESSHQGGFNEQT